MVETNDEEVTLDKEESSALRYCAGYMIRSLLKKVGRSKHRQKDELKKCSAEMTEEPKESTHNSADWIKAIDRGGLIHVHDMVYSVFAEMEIVVCQVYKNSKSSKSAVGQ